MSAKLAGAGQGTGFVNLASHEGAARAIGELHLKHRVGDSALLVQRHIPKRLVDQSKTMVQANPISQSLSQAFQDNVFVKNIPAGVSEAGIREVFEATPGDILSLRVKKIYKRGEPQTEENVLSQQAFILYGDSRAAQRCIQLHDHGLPFGFGYGTRELSVQYWKTKDQLAQERASETA